jgi:hypothetical protein
MVSTSMDEIVQFFTKFLDTPETALVVILLAIAVVSFYKGWVVPKFIYDASEARAANLSKVLGEMTESLRELTTEIRQRSAR